MGAVVVAAALVLWAVRRPSVDAATVAAVDRFFDEYVTEEGRVRRTEGDTVSEGQAYALLMAVATDRPKRFATVWEWTRLHLLRPDGAMAWRWDGGVLDEGLAPDADVDAAVALYLAAERFEAPSYARAGERMADAVLDAAAVQTRNQLQLAAGEWARERGQVVINPSYLDPASFEYLDKQTGDERWAALADSARRMLSRVVQGELPPDWAVMEEGSLRPIASPDEPEEEGRFGFDALRVPIRLAAADCTSRLADAMAPVWRQVSAEPGVAIRHLDGREAVDWHHPAAFVSAAALAQRFEPGKVEELLDRAAASDRQQPSYYGAAWVALGRLMLTSPTLERCA